MIEPIPIPKRSQWVTQFLVIRALLRREMVTRFGKYRLGFFWMLFEPLISVVVIGLVIGQIAERTVPEIPYPFFLLNGFLLLKLFTSPMLTGVNAISANVGLLVYPSVKPLDTLLARFLFDLITTLFSFVVFCVCAIWLGVQPALDHMHIVLAAYVITWLCGCGFGLMFGVGAVYYNELEKIVPVIQRPLLFLSAVLFPTSILSGAALEIYLWNPLVHTIEMSRHAMFPFYKIEGANLMYPFCFAIVVLTLGITIFHNNRDYLSQIR